GGVEYRFAVFFVSFLAMLCIAKLCMDFYLARWQERGCTAALFLMLYAAAGYILDSCRYDAGYFPFNGFVSVLQIFAAFAFLGLAVAFSVRMIRRRSFRWYMVPLWFALLGAMGAAGTLEYLVQRYGDRFLLWYGLMGISCLAIVLLLYLMYALGRPAGAQPEKAEKPAGISPDITDAAAKKPSGPAETEEKNPLALPAGLAAFSAVLAALGLGALLVSKKDRE
ncbi:MAG: hypothetical protein IJ600_13260, partial [Lachnospiraceae bacterium]|nr:hypothetical protein [Lachnospiraceae bacterium]